MSVLGTGIERDQSVAVLAVRLKSVADFLRPLRRISRLMDIEPKETGLVKNKPLPNC
jgi:hypothetical protein